MAIKLRTALVAISLLVSTAILAVPPQHHAMATRVDFSQPAMSAGRLVQDLSKRTGVPLSCSPEVADEVVLMRVNHIALTDVMARIAEVLDARWRQTGDIWLLERPAEMERAEREHEFRDRAIVITKYLNQMISVLKKPWNKVVLQAAIPKIRQDQSSGTLGQDTDHLHPLWRAFLRCLSDVSPETLARIPVGDRIVFATHPTARELPLGKGAEEALRTLPEEQHIFTGIMENAGLSDTPFEWQVSHREDDAARILLIVSSKWFGDPEGDFLVLDKYNRIIDRMEIHDWELVFRGAVAETPAPPGDPIVPLSHNSGLLRSISRPLKSPMGLPVITPHLSPEAKAILSAPTTHEPLSTVISDGYLALARSKNRNIIASLPDRLLSEGLLFSSRPLTLTDVKQWPQYRPAMRLIERDRWLIVMPSDPYAARHERINRAALEKITRRVAQTGIATVNDIAEFAVNAGDKPMYHFGNDYIWALTAGDYGSGGFGEGNWTLLRLYGSLSKEQQRAALSGKIIAYGNLKGLQRTFAEMTVYGARYNGSGGDIMTDLNNEPAERCPNGLPPSAGIHVKAKRKILIDFLEPDKTEAWHSFWRMDANAHGIGGWSGPPPYIPPAGFGVVRYQMRYQDSVTVTADVTPSSQAEVEYDDAAGPPTGPPIPFLNLPQEFKPHVEEMIHSLRQLAGLESFPTRQAPRH